MPTERTRGSFLNSSLAALSKALSASAKGTPMMFSYRGMAQSRLEGQRGLEPSLDNDRDSFAADHDERGNASRLGNLEQKPAAVLCSRHARDPERVWTSRG